MNFFIEDAYAVLGSPITSSRLEYGVGVFYDAIYERCLVISQDGACIGSEPIGGYLM